MVGAVAVVGDEPFALGLAEELTTCSEFSEVIVYGRHPEAPHHAMFARGGARYVFGIEPFPPDTVAAFVAVDDTRVPEMAMMLAAQGRAPSRCAAFHLSGVLPTDALEPLHAAGYAIGAFHPLGSSTGGARRERPLRGSYIALTGSPESEGVGRQLADFLGAEVLSVPAGRRPLVQASVEMARGYLGPLLDLAARLMARAGITADESRPALVAVARDGLRAWELGGAAPAGNPVSAGDVETLALHLRALDPEDQRLYAVLASEVLRLERDTLDPEAFRDMRDLLSRYLDPVTTTTA